MDWDKGINLVCDFRGSGRSNRGRRSRPGNMGASYGLTPVWVYFWGWERAWVAEKRKKIAWIGCRNEAERRLQCGINALKTDLIYVAIYSSMWVNRPGSLTRQPVNKEHSP